MTIDAKTTFSILADGSDETTKIAQAIAASETDEVVFSPGLYGINGLPAISHRAIFRGVGPTATVFKNLSATARAFEFEAQVTGNLKSSYSRMGCFTLDQNGCTGDGIQMKAQCSAAADISMLGQAGAGFAFVAEGTALGKIDGLLITGSTNCLKIKDAPYMHLEHVGIERSTGYGLYVDTSAGLQVDDIYIDTGHESGAVTELVRIINSHGVDINGLKTEIAAAAVPNPTLGVGYRYISIENGGSVNFRGGRISHYGNLPQTPVPVRLFAWSGSDGSIQDMEWREAHGNMIFCGVEGASFPGGPANRNLLVSNINTTIETGNGFTRGVSCANGNVGRVRLVGWYDRAEVPDHYLHASDPYHHQVSGSVTVY